MDLRTNDETFEQLTIEQMEVLEKLDFLSFIATNKQVMRGIFIKFITKLFMKDSQ